MKEYRMLIYNEINRRNQAKRSSSKDIDRCDIRCELNKSTRPKRKSLRSINKPDDDEEPNLDRPYGAKTLYIQNNRKTPLHTALAKEASYLGNHNSLLPEKHPRATDLFPRTKYLTEAK
jgi:hypothetical protein